MYFWLKPPDRHKGVTNQLLVKASGACAFHGSQLLAKDAKVDLNGASRAEVHTTESLDANLSGATKLFAAEVQEISNNTHQGFKHNCEVTKLTFKLLIK